MKTKKLIEELQKADPSGELDVCVDNIDIYFVDIQPGYYDGCQEILIKDENNYVIGGIINSRKDKVKLKLLPIEDAICEDPGMNVEYNSDYAKRNHKDYIKKWRQEAIEILQDIVKDYDKENLTDREKQIKKEYEQRINSGINKLKEEENG